MPSLFLRALMGALLILSACTPDAPATDAPPDADRAAEPQGTFSGTKAERAAAAGLSDEQVAVLDSAGVPVYVPTLPDGWTLVEAVTNRDEQYDPSVPFYSLTYLTPDTTHVFVYGTDGPEVPWASAPSNTRDVAVPGIPSAGLVKLGWGGAGEQSDEWKGGIVSSEGFGENGRTYAVGTTYEEDQRVASVADVETILASLRALDPEMDVAPN
ncbi:MAG TPA: hypothetical protein VF594_08875 [Rubricoccaceae bacterium]|jgi:hypothetical protein